MFEVPTFDPGIDKIHFIRRLLMKKFIVSVLCVTVFCIGLGALVEQAGAKFKSDEKALALIKQARLAIGGDQSITAVRSMIIRGNTGVTLTLNGESRTEQAETEIAMQLPDRLSRKINIRHLEGADREKIVGQNHEVMIMRRGEAPADGEKKVFVRKIEGGNEEIDKVISEGNDGEVTGNKKVVIRKRDGVDAEKTAGGERVKRVMVDHGLRGDHGRVRDNQLLRTTLSLLLTAPEGMDVSYTYAGEVEVDGTACNVVNAEFAGSNLKLYLAKASSLPVMVSYQGHAPQVMFFRSKAPEGIEPAKDKMMFNHEVAAPPMSEIQIRFADYRSVNGVQLPYRWTTSVAGQTTEVFDVTGYEINPANIAEKFQDQKVLVRTKTNN